MRKKLLFEFPNSGELGNSKHKHTKCKKPPRRHIKKPHSLTPSLQNYLLTSFPISPQGSTDILLDLSRRMSRHRAGPLQKDLQTSCWTPPEGSLDILLQGPEGSIL